MQIILCLIPKRENHSGCQRGGAPVVIESIKTTSMEDVNTRVLEKIKNI